MGAHTSHIEEVEAWECEREAEESDFLPPPLPPLRTLTRTQTRGRGGVEELGVLEVLQSSTHTCFQPPSFEIQNMLYEKNQTSPKTSHLRS